MKSRTLSVNLPSPKALGLFVAPRTEAEYDRAVELLDQLVDEIGDKPKNPRYRLIETLSALIEGYDKEHHEMPDVSGVDMLRFLMDQHALTQVDLKKELGGQSVVSEILNHKRELNVHQMRALGARFGVDPGVFI